MNFDHRNHFSIEDIVFENKNKAYGAYVLRKKYDDNMAKGMLAGLLTITLLIVIPSLIKYFKGEEIVIKTPMELLEEVTLVETYYEPEQVKPKLEVPKTAATSVATVKNVSLDVRRDEEVKIEEIIPAIKDLTDRIISTVNTEGSLTKLDMPPLILKPAGNEGSGGGTIAGNVNTSTPTYSFVQHKPEFPGGNEALLKYLYTHIKYPQMAIENRIEGMVVLKFTVTKNGEIDNIKVIRELGGGCDKEAIRVVSNMPKWKPGIHNDKAVNCYFTLPIKFDLE